MREGARPEDAGAWSRAGFLRAALAGGAVVSGGAALGAGRPAAGARAAAPPPRYAEGLYRFHTLEDVPPAFYEQAVRSGGLDGPRRDFAATVAGQEAQHAAM